MPAGAPSQRAITEGILNIPHGNNKANKARQDLIAFLDRSLRINEKQFKTMSLEDIYTPIDRCIAQGINFKGKNVSQLLQIRDNLGYLISCAVAQAIQSAQQSPGTDYIRAFANYAVRKTSGRVALAATASHSRLVKLHDPISIISLNWDILLDNAVYQSLLQHDSRKGDYDPFGVVDYCCYASSLEPRNSRIRSALWTLGCKGFNVKLLKLHGSMNWLQCPSCQRIFIAFGSKLQMLDKAGRSKCRHCNRHGQQSRLRSALIMPTFLKDLTNFQIQLIWHNAGIELMEATRLVFIGYSLPHADFEFRQLLSRMVQRDTEVEVVLLDKTTSFKDECRRYNEFFGDRLRKIYKEGAESYIEEICSESS